MNKTLLFACLLFVNMALNAQTIASENIVNYGDTIFNSTDVAPSINIGTTGTGNAWNFSSLQSNSVDSVYFYHPFYVAGNAATTTFPYASHAFKGDTNFIFLQKSSYGLELLGISNGTIHVASQDPETIITFPSSYGTSFKDTARTNTTISGADAGQPLADSIRIVSQTFIESDFNASGSLTTPFGIFSSIRQSLRRETSTDIYAKGALTGGVYTLLSSELDTANSHQYWSDAVNAKFPLVSYEIDATGGVKGDVTWTNKFTELNNVGTKELEKKSLRIYPNPVQNLLTIDNQDEIKTISIMDITGKVVYRVEKQNKKTVAVNFLRKGIYILSIETDNYTGSTKFIKQ